MSTLTTQDALYIPTGTDQIAPLQTVLANMQNSVQTALINRGKQGTSSVPNVAARNALFPTPTGGESVYRVDLGYTERYFPLYNVTTAPGGAAAAGWYPTTPFALKARATRNVTSNIATGSSRTPVTLNTIDPALSRGASWSITSGGLVAPIAGEYQVRLRLNWAGGSDGNAGNRFTSLLVNGAEPYGIIDTRTNAGTSGVYITLFETLQLNAGDYVQPGVAQTSGVALALNNPAGDLTMWYVGHR